jgi:uncharacterized membrane protein YkvA (DUF1232 family)
MGVGKGVSCIKLNRLLQACPTLPHEIYKIKRALNIKLGNKGNGSSVFKEETMPDSADQQPTAYSDPGFWEKVKSVATQAGKQVVERALILYYAAQRPETPTWAKMVIYTSLAYFVLPTDAVPDFTPFVGYSDDLGTLLSALAAVAMSINPEVKESARQKTQEWFGEDAEELRDYPQAGDAIREITID